MSLQIRPAVEQDTTAIITLLKESLGESTIPKSERLWRWKHEQSPFGKSFVMVAEDDGKLVGVRAFMQWQFQRRKKLFRAIRAVDTATHPDYQGKGIFKKLTLQQAEICKEQGIQFIFNTPNKQSKPGYIKMGWEEMGKQSLKLKLIRPVSMAVSKLAGGKKKDAADPSPAQKWKQEIFNLMNDYVVNESEYATVMSPDYISWRYANNPLFGYNYFTDGENFLLISRIKSQSFGKELRIADFALLNDGADCQLINTVIHSYVRNICRENAIAMVSVSGHQYRLYRDCFKWMGILPVLSAGPLITMKNLNIAENFHYVMNTRNWAFSLGDLELF